MFGNAIYCSRKLDFNPCFVNIYCNKTFLIIKMTHNLGGLEHKHNLFSLSITSNPDKQWNLNWKKETQWREFSMLFSFDSVLHKLHICIFYALDFYFDACIFNPGINFGTCIYHRHTQLQCSLCKFAYFCIKQILSRSCTTCVIK